MRNPSEGRRVSTPDRILWQRVLRARDIHGVQAVLLDTSIHVLDVHWNASLERTRPHYPNDCPFCDGHIEPREAGFVAAQAPDGGVTFTLWLTQLAAFKVYQHQKANGGRLRGLVLHVFRTRSDKSAPCDVRFYDYVDESKLRSWFDVYGDLAPLFKLAVGDLRAALGLEPSPADGER